MEPRVYHRLLDNWLELTIRFVLEDRGIREVEDVMGREILEAFDAAGIGSASATFDILGLPSIHLGKRG